MRGFSWQIAPRPPLPPGGGLYLLLVFFRLERGRWGRRGRLGRTRRGRGRRMGRRRLERGRWGRGGGGGEEGEVGEGGGGEEGEGRRGRLGREGEGRRGRKVVWAIFLSLSLSCMSCLISGVNHGARELRTRFILVGAWKSAIFKNASRHDTHARFGSLNCTILSHGTAFISRTKRSGTKRL